MGSEGIWVFPDLPERSLVDGFFEPVFLIERGVRIGFLVMNFALVVMLTARYGGIR